MNAENNSSRPPKKLRIDAALFENDSEKSKLLTLAPAVIEALNQAAVRIAPMVLAHRLWERLTSDERRSLGDDFQRAYSRLGTVGIWRQVKSCSRVRAALDVAYEIGFLTEPDYRWLLRETEGATGPSGPSPAGASDGAAASATSVTGPRWDRDTGWFSYDGKKLERFQIRLEATQPARILGAFQDADWCVRVANPLACLPSHEVAQSLKHLNRRLGVIRIHAQENSKSLRWERTAEESS